MTPLTPAQVQAARERVETWLDNKPPAHMADGHLHVYDLRTLLAALDQAAEALRPFADVVGQIDQEARMGKLILSRIVSKLGPAAFRTAAQAHALIKGEG